MFIYTLMADYSFVFGWSSTFFESVVQKGCQRAAGDCCFEWSG
jgi:hypothetical protein